MDYVVISGHTKKGDIHISRTIVEKIVGDAVNNILGVSIQEFKPKSKFLASLFGPIRITFHRNGEVEVNIDISLKKGVNAEEVCLNIQEEVSNALMAYTESVPFAINIKVVEIK